MKVNNKLQQLSGQAVFLDTSMRGLQFDKYVHANLPLISMDIIWLAVCIPYNMKQKSVDCRLVICDYLR